MEKPIADEEFDIDFEKKKLLKNIIWMLPELSKLLQYIKYEKLYEEGMLNFYDDSKALMNIKNITYKILNVIESIYPDYILNEYFLNIIEDSRNYEVDQEKNKKSRIELARPVIEAFLHAKYFLEMLIATGTQLRSPPLLPRIYWLSVLTLYRLN